MKAFKLININGNDCSFLEGTIPEKVQIKADHFFTQTSTEVQFFPHPAPRYQFVITIKGKLKFTVTNGNSFIIEPGIILIAKDLLGKGHTWEIMDGNEWHRVYVVPNADDADYFVPTTH
jgi:quercetin dioxygenase-like cupin family protein